MLSSNKPRLLFVCSRPPYPPIGGDRLKNYYLIPELAKSFDLTMICIGSAPLPASGRDYLEHYGKLYFWHKTRFDFLRNVAAWPFRLPVPLQSSLYYFQDVKDKVEELAASHDVIFCNMIRTAPYAEGLAIHKFCDIGDNNGSYYANLTKRRRFSPMGVYGLLDQPYIERYEKRVINTFDHCFMFNPDELEEYGVPGKLTYIPHGVSPFLVGSNPVPDPAFSNTLVFLGKMSTLPNISAVEWFISEVMPLLPPELTFAVIGADPPERIKALANDRVRVLGFVEDPYPALRGAAAVVAPMQLGRGVQNKVLEAMAVGGLCILTSPPARALINVQHGREFFIADRPEEYAALIKQIVARSADYSSIRDNARQYIIDNHSWERAGAIYTSAINRVLSQ